MSGKVANLAEKIQTLSSEQIAEVEDFVELLRLRGQERALVRTRAETSAHAFEAVWDNPEDNVYDAL